MIWTKYAWINPRHEIVRLRATPPRKREIIPYGWRCLKVTITSGDLLSHVRSLPVNKMCAEEIARSIQEIP